MCDAQPARGADAFARTTRALLVRVVDALPVIRSSRFDLPLTYEVADCAPIIGEVVRVPLGTREMLAFTVSAVREIVQPSQSLRQLLEVLDVPRAFDETGLHLAKFISRNYLCTLGEALGAVTLADSVPRMRDSLVRGERPSADRLPSVPPRLVRLIWEDLGDEFRLDQLIRHPEARKIADRSALLTHVRALVRAGALQRDRRLIDPRTGEYRLRILELGEGAIRGKKAEALVAYVKDHPSMPRADALLAGFSNAVIARAVRIGALRERLVRPAPAPRARAPARSVLTATVEQRRALEWIGPALDEGRLQTALLHGVQAAAKRTCTSRRLRKSSEMAAERSSSCLKSL
jgi:primosomal protein N'